MNNLHTPKNDPDNAPDGDNLGPQKQPEAGREVENMFSSISGDADAASPASERTAATEAHTNFDLPATSPEEAELDFDDIQQSEYDSPDYVPNRKKSAHPADPFAPRSAVSQGSGATSQGSGAVSHDSGKNSADEGEYSASPSKDAPGSGSDAAAPGTASAAPGEKSDGPVDADEEAAEMDRYAAEMDRLDALRGGKSGFGVIGTQVSIVVFFLIILGLIVTYGYLHPKKSRVGVTLIQSAWHNQLRSEFQHAADILGDELIVTQRNSAHQQIEDIDSFISQGITAIIITPVNDSVGTAITRAREAGARVIVGDEEVRGAKYDAFIGGDNFDVGRKAALYIIDQLDSVGTVVEVMASNTSRNAKDRHQGFIEGLDQCAGMRVLPTITSDWNDDTVSTAVLHAAASQPEPDFVFLHTDEMAPAVAAAYQKLGMHPRLIGVDCLPPPGPGYKLLETGVLEASICYPTYGTRYVGLLDSLLSGNLPPRRIVYNNTLVTRQSLQTLFYGKLAVMSVADSYAAVYAENRRMQDIKTYGHIASAAFVVMILILVGSLTQVMLRKRALRRQVKLATERIDHIEMTLRDIRNVRRVLRVLSCFSTPYAEGTFQAEVQRVIFKNISNADLTPTDVAIELGIDQEELEKKVNRLARSSVQSLIVISRLIVAQRLVKQGGQSVAEIAESCGFASASHFTVLYRHVFGFSPSENHFVPWIYHHRPAKA